MTGRPRILIVEDSPDDAELLLAILREGGFQPSHKRVQTEEEMRAALAGEAWDLVLSDYSMPSFDAIGALRVLRESGGDIPAIVVSGTVGEDIAVETLKVGADDYLLKENLRRLVPAVERALRDSEGRRRRRDADMALRQNAQIFAQLHESVICVDREGKIFYWGEGARKLHGWTAAEMIGQPVQELFPPDVDIRSALQSGSFVGETQVRRKDADPIWVELRMTPLTGEDGQSSGFIGVARDISSRKAREEALHLRDRALAEISQGVLISDESRRIVYANAAFLKITGYHRSEILGRNCSILQGAGTDPATVLRMRAALNAKEPFEGVILNYRNDGSIFWNELSISPIGEAGGGVKFIGILRDITERIRSENELKSTVERVQVAASATGVGIWELDIRTGEAKWDEQMFALFGEPVGETVGGVERWFRAMSPDDIAKCEAVLDDAIHAGRDFFEIEYTITRLDNGSPRLIQSKGVVERDAGGAAVKMIGSNRDITEDRARETSLAKALAQEKALLQEAQAGERAKGEFLAVMSHEIRTPMNGILGFAELLCQAPELPESCRDYAQTIATSGEALLRILDDVLDFSRLETGRLEVEKKPFSPREILEDIRLLFSRRAEESGLALVVRVDVSVPENLLGDVGRFRQVLVNLVGNAIKFTERGRVDVEFRRAGNEGMFECAVRDTGPGIAPGKLDAVFEPFVQGDGGISRRYGGTGLGLAISRRLMTLLGGGLEVRSEIGKGSEFIVRIPLEIPKRAEVPVVTPAALDATFAGRHPLNVLVVEDDKVNLKLVRALIRRLGYEPLAAVNGREAVDIVRSDRLDCVFMDLQMPEMDGIEAAGRIRALERENPGARPAYISALTANIFPADRQRCIDVGMNDYLNKPVKLAQLAEVLKRAAARSL